MKIEENNIDLLENASAGKRILSWIIDFLPLSISEFLIFIGIVFQVIKVMPGYIDADKGREREMLELYSYSVSAHLIELKEDNTPVSESEMFYRFCYKEILLSFDEFKTEFSNNGVEEILNPLNQEKSSISNNELLYFYLDYVPNNGLIDYKGVSPLSYYVNTVCEGTSLGEYYLINATSIEIPVLKSSFAISLYNELKESKRSTSFQNLYSFYDTIYQKASKVITSLDAYKEIYAVYEAYYYKSAAYTAYGILLSHLLSFLIFYLIVPMFCFGYGASIGRRIFLEASTHENKPIPKGLTALRSLFYFFETYCSLFLSFSLFFGFNLLKSPLFVIGSLQISNAVFALFSAFILLINFFAVLIRRDNRTISEALLKIDVKDARHYTEGK